MGKTYKDSSGYDKKIYNRGNSERKRHWKEDQKENKDRKPSRT